MNVKQEGQEGAVDRNLLVSLRNECRRRPELRSLWDVVFEAAIALCRVRTDRAWDAEMGGFIELPPDDVRIIDAQQRNFDRAKENLLTGVGRSGGFSHLPNFTARDICDVFVH